MVGLAQARELLGTVSEGGDPRPERREANLLRHTNTVETVAKRFIEQDAKRTVASWQNIQRVLDLHVVPHLGSTPIRDVRRGDVHALLDELVAGDKVGTTREVCKHLSRMFNWAVDRELIGDSPVHGLRRADLDPNSGLVTVWFRLLVSHYATRASKAKGLMPPRNEWRLRAL